MADTPKKKPFGFEVTYELFNAREERLRELLLIENPGSGQVLNLGIANALVAENECIILRTRAQASASSYHFRLRFPAGALSRRTVGVEGEDWLVAREDKANEPTSLYLSWRGPDVTLQPGEWLALGLKGVSAQAAAGAQVVMSLDWPEPSTQAATASALFIEARGPGQGGKYEREAQRPLGTLNRLGRPDCPLRAGFVGAHQVLNVDNAQGTLRLRLSNEAPAGSQDGTLRFVYDANEPTRTSRMVVALPVGTVADAPWALGTEQQVKDITFSTLTNWSRSSATLSTDGKQVEWTFTPTKEVTLAPRAAWELQLGKLVTLHPNGSTQLVLRYQNVPGFWDGERVCVIEKAPLVFGQKVDASHDYSSHVGIGNATPTARLYLRNGPLRLNNAEVQNEGPLVFRSDADKTGDKSSVRFFNKDETTTPLMELDVEGQLEVRTTHRKYGFLQTGISEGVTVRVGSFADQQGGWLGTKSEHALHFFTHDGQPQVTLATDGTLSVREGRIKDKTGWLVPVGTIVSYAGSTAPAGWLSCDGSTKSQNDYKDLYAVIGQTYQGSSAPPSGQFRLPSLLARVPMGAYVSSPHDYPLGTMGGEFTHTLTIPEMPRHDHFVRDPGHSHNVAGRNNEPKDDDEGRHPQNWVSSYKQFPFRTDSAKTGIGLDTNGGGQPHNNLQPYTTVNFIIKY